MKISLKLGGQKWILVYTFFKKIKSNCITYQEKYKQIMMNLCMQTNELLTSVFFFFGKMYININS